VIFKIGTSKLKAGSVETVHAISFNSSRESDKTDTQKLGVGIFNTDTGELHVKLSHSPRGVGSGGRFTAKLGRMSCNLSTANDMTLSRQMSERRVLRWSNGDEWVQLPLPDEASGRSVVATESPTPAETGHETGTRSPQLAKASSLKDVLSTLKGGTQNQRHIGDVRSAMHDGVTRTEEDSYPQSSSTVGSFSGRIIEDDTNIDKLEWTFAIILGPDEEPPLAEKSSLSFLGFVQQTCKELQENDFEMMLVPHSDTSKNRVIFLVKLKHAEDHFFVRACERWKECGEGLELTPGGDVSTGYMTEADRVQLTAEKLEKCSKDKYGHMEHFDDVKTHDKRVIAVFPIHNRDWVNKWTELWELDMSLLRQLKYSVKLLCVFDTKLSSVCRCCVRGQDSRAKQKIQKLVGKLKMISKQSVTDSEQTRWENSLLQVWKDDNKEQKCDEATIELLLAKIGVHPTQARMNSIVKEMKDKTQGVEQQQIAISAEAFSKVGAAEARKFGRTTPWQKLKRLATMKDTIGGEQRGANYTTSTEEFLLAVKDQYGVRIAFLFAFNKAAQDAMICLCCLLTLLFVAFRLVIPSEDEPGGANNYTKYLQVTGIIGLLVPSVWGTMFLGFWDRMATHLFHEWSLLGLKEPERDSPFFEEPDKPEASTNAPSTFTNTLRYLKPILHTLFFLSAVAGIAAVSMGVLAFQVLHLNTPVCGSWFYETVWKDYVANVGVHASSRHHPQLTSWATVVDCYETSSENFVQRDGVGRAAVLMSCDIVEGLLMGVVYTEIFTMLAEVFAQSLNKKTWQEYEAVFVNFAYPFEALSTLLYLWIMAFVFMPGTTSIMAWLLDNSEPFYANFENATSVPNATLGTFTPSSSVNDMLRFWFHDKRFKIHIGAEIGVPVAIALCVPMIFEYLLPALAISWRRFTRWPVEGSAQDTSKSKGKYKENLRKEAGSCFLQEQLCCLAGCFCCGRLRNCRQACSSCTMVCCCNCTRGNCVHCCKVAQVSNKWTRCCNRNLCCDEPSYTGDHAVTNSKILKALNQKNDDAAKAEGRDDELLLSLLNKNAGTAKMKLHTDKRQSEEDDPLTKADELVIESGMEPIDLPTEFISISIVLLLVGMWTIVSWAMPLIGLFVLYFRFRYGFVIGRVVFSFDMPGLAGSTSSEWPSFRGARYLLQWMWWTPPVASDRG
jgi:hypothetical protein